MAQISSPLFLISLLLFSVVTPPAHATFVGPFNVLRVTGQLCCTANGNCPGTPVVGAVVTLNCINSFVTQTVGQNTTTTNGFFTITAPAPSGLLSSFGLPPSCYTTVQLPLSAAVCPALSTTTSTLVGLTQVVGNVVNQILSLGVVAFVNLQGF